MKNASVGKIDDRQMLFLYNSAIRAKKPEAGRGDSAARIEWRRAMSRRQKIKIFDRNASNDIRYRGPLSYRHL